MNRIALIILLGTWTDGRERLFLRNITKRAKQVSILALVDRRAMKYSPDVIFKDYLRFLPVIYVQ